MGIHLYTILGFKFIMKLLFLIAFLYSCFYCGHGKLCYAEPGMDTYNRKHNDCCFPEDGDSDFILGLWRDCHNVGPVEEIKKCMTEKVIDLGEEAWVHCFCGYIPLLC